MVKSFEVAWPREKFDTLRAALRRYRLPATPREAAWEYGCDGAFLKDLCTYWAEEFDAEAAAATLNRYPQIVTEIDGIAIHAVHVVGEAGGKRPLLLCHGWPGSHYEFWQVIEKLAFPSRHGGRQEDAFDLVIPSLPGFGFSGKPVAPIGARTTARLFATLMRERLGYERFCVQGGDWGAAVNTWLALDHAASVKAMHLTLMIVHPRATPETPEEIAWGKARDDAQQRLGAYAMLQATKPRSLAYAIADNPVAQAAWIVERFYDWSDRRERRFEDIFSRDELLTNIMIYVMNEAFVSAIYYYAAAVSERVRILPEGRRIEVPTAFAAYPDPRMPAPPRHWIERGYNLTRWTEPPRGGHFAAMEEPGYFVDDLREWGRGIA
jgi:pimeloyl-ACP methyl ester carboxylesterase